MKKEILIFVMMILITGLFSQIQWQTDGIPVRQGVNIEWFRSGIALDDGSVVYVWSDTRRSERDVWAQKVDSDGNLEWGEEAILVNGEADRQEDIVVIDTDGGVITAWVDFRNEDAGDIYAQKLDNNGNLLWDPIGVPLCIVEDVQISLNIVDDANGGAYIIWIDHRNPGGTDIYGTHILSDGSIANGWDANGNPIAAAAGSQNQHTFWEDGNGGAIMAWHDVPSPEQGNIYIQRISSDGTLLWGDEGILLCDAQGMREKPKITPDGSGSFIITWRDKRNENDGDIYSQRIDLNGNLLWAEEIEICVGTGIQKNARITKSSDNGAFIVWEDGRNDFYYKDIYIQKIDLNGNLLWDPAGLSLCTEDYDQLNPRLVSDLNSGCWIVWDDARGQGYPYVDIYLQHLDADGNIPAGWDNSGKIVCNADGEQFSPLVKRNPEGDAFITWGDKRTGSTGIYFQVFDENGDQLLEENGEIIYYGLDGNAEKFQILKNNNNPVTLWIDTRFSTKRIYMQTLDADGIILTENGQPITSTTGYDQENMDSAALPNADCIAVVWEEIRGDFKQVYAQGIDTNGNFLWPDTTGIAVAEFYCSQEMPKISARSTGRQNQYFVGWMDSRDIFNPDIYGQLIIDGQKQWADEGVQITSRTGQDEMTDVVENFFIWQGWIGTSHKNIFIKLIDENGNTPAGWPEDGLEICAAEGNQGNAKGTLVPEGILVVWEDKRNGNFDIYGQIITYDGNTLWQEDGAPLVLYDDDQALSNFSFAEDLFMCWADFRNGNNYDVFVQKYDNNGSELWTENGLEIAVKDSNEVDPYLVRSGDYSVVFWEDYYYSTAAHRSTELYAQMVDSDGNLQWDPLGLEICSAIKNQGKPMATTDDNNNVYVVWQDTRSSGKEDIYSIYAQKLFDYTAVDYDFEPDKYITINNYPNPLQNSTEISFNLNVGSLNNPEINIYNIKGQLVHKLLPEENKISWDGRNSTGRTVSSGIYFYRLEADDLRSKTRKMVVLR